MWVIDKYLRYIHMYIYDIYVYFKIYRVYVYIYILYLHCDT